MISSRKNWQTAVKVGLALLCSKLDKLLEIACVAEYKDDDERSFEKRLVSNVEEISLVVQEPVAEPNLEEPNIYCVQSSFHSTKKSFWEARIDWGAQRIETGHSQETAFTNNVESEKDIIQI